MSNRINLGNIMGATGPTGPQGQPGLNGSNGLTPEIRSGNWWIGAQDLGVQAEGSKWYKGSAVPTNQGKDGDLYLRTTTNDVYYKENGAWSIVTNIKGDTALSVQIGTVTTVSPNTPASVTNSGTDTDLVLDFEIPKGEDGGVPTVSTANKIYATDSNGDQTTIEYGSSQTNSANKIVQRDANRDVLVPSTPTSNNGATSKRYVDNLTTPTAWTDATKNTTYVSNGTCRYCIIGKIVIVQMYDIQFTQSAIDYFGSSGSLIAFSNLPNGDAKIINAGTGSNNIITLNVENGDIKSWFSSPQNTSYYYNANFVYVMED